jgi:anaerobic selenocysteine-containing dehydrogenase
MKLNRRQFMAGSAATAGAAVFVACGLPERELIVQSPAELPEDLVRGEDAWYATAWGDATGGDGLIVRVMQGRAKKIAGNPDFPVNLGKQSARYDAALQMLYHPDRITQPLARRSKGGELAKVPWAEAERRLLDAIEQSSGSLAVVTNPLRGHLGWVASEFAGLFGGRHVSFDPVEQGVLHGAVKNVFGQDRLPDVDIANAHTVLSFGADWLSTWVSPVGMSVKYGRFRGQEGHGYLVHVESRMSMTAAAADRWLPVKPGWEGAVALAIARIILDENWAAPANAAAYRANMPVGALDNYSIGRVAGTANSGVSAERLAEAAEKFARNGPSVAFGGGSAGAHTNGSFNLRAIYTLNYLSGAVGTRGGIMLNPASPVPGVPDSARGAPFGDWEKELAQWRAGNVKTVIVRGADLVHGLPRSVDAPGALAKVPTVIAFATVLDDTSAHADLVLPEKTFLETWGTDIPDPAPGYQVVGIQQPVVGATVKQDTGELLSDSRGFGDVLLWASGGGLGAADMRELVRKSSDSLFDLKRASDSVNAPGKDLFWTGVLQRGGWWDVKSAVAQRATAPDPTQGAAPATFADAPDGDGAEMTLVPFVSNALLDGRLAAAPWSQATPDPVSSAVWSTWAEVNKDDALELGVQEGDRLLIRSSVGEIEALAYPHPGVPPGIVAVPMGQGHEHNGQYAAGRGSNVLSVLAAEKDSETGALAWAATRVRVIRQGVKVKVPKFEGNVEAFPIEPGVPVRVVAPGQTAHQAEQEDHEEAKREMTERANK